MKAQEILSKIKEVVGIELSEEVSVQLEEIKLENGTILEAEKFESGQSVFIKTEEENIALPVGEYKLEDGRSLMVKEEGLIDEIMDKIEEKEEVKAAEETVENTEMEEHEEKEEKEDMKYVTKEEFAKAIEEIKTMIEAMDHKEKEEMSKEENSEVELSAEVAEPIKHNPEKTDESSINFKIAANRRYSTRDRVFDAIFKNN
ncbi:MAG: hypothetical protein CBD69_005905 [Crocinitomicaceae bacterium TMED209]|nr:MAG: hypothetical protein CBD69_005905 [Crocinitomicaceae bacterium TMED209]